MISKAVVKFTLIRFFRERLTMAFYLGGMILFLVIILAEPPILQFEPLPLFIYRRSFFFNILVVLVLSAGILGREISEKFIDMILCKPVKKLDIYILVKS